GEEVELNRTLVDIEALIYEILSKHERLAQQKQAKVEVEVEPDLPLLYVDDMLYGQAVGNLVHNALKYTPDSVCVTVKAYRDGDGRVAVAVSDTGTGIREEDQARLFEAFYRVPQREGEPDKPKGSGIGLALVKAIAEAHGGSVCVESTFGEGSTFTISVPLRHPSDE
ncbi:MAG TPA: HAMP domain-containing sensor histidine kinase, partial [Aggregatilineales bacterium]|nr:HAMP domain-containing sensor histidine kinase [Aggregatilineales bacterium]